MSALKMTTTITTTMREYNIEDDNKCY